MIGKALEDYTNTDPSTVGQIMVLVNVSYADPTTQIAITQNGDLSVNGNLLGTQTTQTTSSITTTDQLHTLSTTVSQLQNQIASMSSQIGKIDDLSKQLVDLQKTVNLNQLPAAPSTQSAVLGTATTSEDTIIGGKLNVLGRTVLSDLGVTGTINTGLLTINGLDTSLGTSSATINTLTSPLKIQSLATAGVDFENGKVTIDTNGNIVVNGDITAKTVKADQYEANASGDNASVGEATILAGQTQVVIKTTTVNDKSHIFLTSRTNILIPLNVTVRSNGASFTVEMGQPLNKDTSFDWWVVNEK